jgi:hypothetical protein
MTIEEVFNLFLKADSEERRAYRLYLFLFLTKCINHKGIDYERYSRTN